MPFHPSSALTRLLDAPVRPGRPVWIGLRGERRGPMSLVDHAELTAGRGLDGDRYSRLDGARQVTLIERENLLAVASFLGRDAIDPKDVRRNLVVEGINLLALKGRSIRVGRTVLEIRGECHPCSRMEEVLGTGGYNALRGHGGVTAKVTVGGIIGIGDIVGRADG